MPDRIPDPGSPYAVTRRGRDVAYLLGWIGLFLIQGAITLGLFGPDNPWRRLTDDRPILSGRHPLHLYHGLLGVRHWLRDGSFSAYDPAFQAGYPKSPAFDAGGRPVELLYLVVGGRYQPAVYKLGMAAACLLAPFGFVIAARLVGSGARTSLLAGLIGVAVLWSPPTRELIESGDVGLLLAAMAALLHVGFLERFHARPGPGNWGGLIVTSGMGWYLHPVFGGGTVLLAVGGWLKHARRHGLDWHMLLVTALAIAVLINADGLAIWSRSWWACLPEDSSPAGAPPGVIGLVILAAFALAGVKARPSMTAMTLSGLIMGLLALTGGRWEPAVRAEAAKLSAIAAWFAVPAAAEACTHALCAFGLPNGGAVRAAVASVVVLVVGFFLFQPSVWFGWPDWGPRALTIGFSSAQRAVIDRLYDPTTTGARILWDDSGRADENGWAVLLPMLTGRPMVGGLDADGRLEHAAIGLRDGWLAGRPLGQWTDTELAGYCRRYNVGWVAVRSPAAVERFARLPGAERQTPVAGRTELFRLDHPNSFILRGQGRWLSADSHAVTLADVIPEKGEVVLSLHYQNGWHVRPGNVHIEREPDAYDPVPFIRLRLPGPVARLALEWVEP